MKGGRVLDALAACSSVALDKTGTLTTGVLVATGMLPPGAAARPHRGAGSALSALLCSAGLRCERHAVACVARGDLVAVLDTSKGGSVSRCYDGN